MHHALQYVKHILLYTRTPLVIFNHTVLYTFRNETKNQWEEAREEGTRRVTKSHLAYVYGLLHAGGSDSSSGGLSLHYHLNPCRSPPFLPNLR